MWSHEPVSRLLIAYPAGDHDIAAVHPDPHILSRHEERITVVAILAAKFMVYPDPLTHGDAAGERYVAVAPFGVLVKCQPRLTEQYPDPFLCHQLCCRILRALLHNGPSGILLCILWVSHVKKSR
jgi:hypothetical protein